jgi:hypothetical protein
MEQGREQVQAACYLSTQQPDEQNGIRTVAYRVLKATSAKPEVTHTTNITPNYRPYRKFCISVLSFIHMDHYMYRACPKITWKLV